MGIVLSIIIIGNFLSIAQKHNMKNFEHNRLGPICGRKLPWFSQIFYNPKSFPTNFISAILYAKRCFNSCQKQSRKYFSNVKIKSYKLQNFSSMQLTSIVYGIWDWHSQLMPIMSVLSHGQVYFHMEVQLPLGSLGYILLIMGDNLLNVHVCMHCVRIMQCCTIFKF